MKHTNGKPRSDQKEPTDHQKNERMMARWTRTVGIFTVALALVALGSALISYFQLSAMKGQLTAFIDSDRPWVGIDQVNLDPLAVGKPVHIVITYKNFGRSPATHMRSLVAFTVRGADEAPLETVPAVPPEGSIIILMPNAIMLKNFTSTDTTDNVLFDLIYAGQKIIWIGIRIEYTDQVGRWHSTISRNKYLPKTNELFAVDGSAD